MGCDFELDTKLVDDYISIHAPIVGCDAPTFIKTGFELLFQSTHPSWGATLLLVLSTQMILISIHAPIVGCDCFLFRFFLSSINISIHAPIVGCDFSYRCITMLTKLISIHAPIVGCDQSKKFPYNQHILFQSTHPSWGATISLSVFLLTLIDFNPRTHRGVRP